MLEAAVVLALVAVAAALTIVEAVAQAAVRIVVSSRPVVLVVRVSRVLLGTL